MGSFFNLRTIIRGALGTVGSFLVGMSCGETPEAQCITQIVGSFLIGLGLAIGSSGQSVKNK